MEIKAKVQQIKTSVKVKFLSAIFLDVFPRAKYNYLKAGFKEFDKDLAILLTWFDNPEGKQVPSKAVDEIWHSMILYTQKYGDFCKTHYSLFTIFQEISFVTVKLQEMIAKPTVDQEEKLKTVFVKHQTVKQHVMVVLDVKGKYND